jgi:hypothetical protein
MEARTRPRRPEPSLSASVRIDATRSGTWLQAICELAQAPYGAQVFVDVADVLPDARDQRSAPFLVEHAHDRGLKLEVQGTPEAVRQWLIELSSYWPSPRSWRPPTARHLTPVPSPGDGDSV